MHTFRVEFGGPDSHPVHVGAGILGRLGELARERGLRPGRSVLLSDSNVARLYAGAALTALQMAAFDPVLIELPPGETSKSLEMLGRVYQRMSEAELDRQSALFALGGGVTGDLGGFAAATYLRGIPLVQVPTTVVAQVDSALGGKTAVNHRDAKNLIGAFYQPRMIVADVATLQTLPERVFREGLAEVIKYGAIMDAAMISDLERDLDAIMRRDCGTLESMVERSLRHKAAVVTSDEREAGRRRILNFGHTIGHALEALSAYETYLHGEAVAIGIAAACVLSRAYAGLGENDAIRLVRLIERCGLPVAMPARWDTEEFSRALHLDKKRAGEGIEFVLIDRLGHALTRNLRFEEIVAKLG